jgi:uncharacterized protein (TIGR02246 family)
MRRSAYRMLAFGLLACGLPGMAMAEPSGDAAIRNIQTAQEVAWNAHDANAFAQLFAEDADAVNVLGWQWTGRAEIEQKLGDAFAYVFAASRLHIDDVRIRSLSPDLALAHVTWSMTGARNADGSGGNAPQRGIETQLLQRSGGGEWRILSFQNTVATPEHPFPTNASAEQVKAAQPHRCLVANRNGNCWVQR